MVIWPSIVCDSSFKKFLFVISCTLSYIENPIFAIFKFSQSALAAAAFFYSNQLELPYQLLLLVILCGKGLILFG